MRNRYVLGSDVLGGEITIPSAGITYTDRGTVTAVQQALAARGFDPGKVDGVFGPKTAAAIKRMQAAADLDTSGVIDYGVLMALKVDAARTATQAATASASAALSAPASAPSFLSRLTAPVPPPAPGQPEPGFLMRPLWPGAPVRVWQAGFGTVAGLALAFGIVSAVRR